MTLFVSGIDPSVPVNVAPIVLRARSCNDIQQDWKLKHAMEKVWRHGIV